jgi:two-component system nitrogen regulation sensor histidine kinase NtrY
MAYKHFRLNCVFRTLLIGANIFLFIYLISNTSLYITGTLAAAGIIAQLILMIRYIEKTNRDLTRFLESIQYSDFSFDFTSAGVGSSFKELSAAFRRVADEFRNIRAEKEQQYRYLQTVVKHIGLGLIAFDQHGEIDILNDAARQLLGVTNIKNIKKLSAHFPSLVEALVNLKPGDKGLVKIVKDGEPLTIIIYATEFKQRDRSIKLVSMQNIESELAEQEMESWQKLIRILTHEIMNSVTPIASLASTVSRLIANSSRPDNVNHIELEAEAARDIHQAAATIEKRSHGLLNFIDAYRNLTKIPTPNFQIFMVSELFERVSQLMKNQLAENHISLNIEIEPSSLELTADKELIEQVLINLILNAIQALKNIPDAGINLKAYLDDNGRTSIVVSDNGIGIDEQVKEKIFLPFFTTKKDGAGIGLSLSKQIMRLHKGNIAVQSDPGKLTSFILRF